MCKLFINLTANEMYAHCDVCTCVVGGAGVVFNMHALIKNLVKFRKDVIIYFIYLFILVTDLKV